MTCLKYPIWNTGNSRSTKPQWPMHSAKFFLQVAQVASLLLIPYMHHVTIILPTPTITIRIFLGGHFTPLEMICPPELGLNDKLSLSQQVHSTVS